MPTPQPGRIVWYELLSTDPDGARAFYPDVVGWGTQTAEMPHGPYTMWTTAAGPHGGVTRLPEHLRAAGVPSYWQANVEVADVAAAVATVRRLGGAVYVEETVPGVGDLAVIGDPQGAVIALVAPTRDMATRDRARPGEVGWHELYTTDHAAAFGFYQELCGWERLGAMDLGPMGTYLLWGQGGVQQGGMMTLPPGMTTPDGRTVPPSWMYYVVVTDLDAALARATARGAKVLSGPMEVPTGQRVVQLLDPQGAATALTTPPR